MHVLRHEHKRDEPMPMATHCLIDALTEELASRFVSEQWAATVARKRELVKVPW